jgi:hypothetical protein
MKRVAMIVATMLAAPRALSCPFCESDTAAQTRAGLMSADALPNLAAAVLPFTIVTMVALAIHCEWPRVKKARSS